MSALVRCAPYCLANESLMVPTHAQPFGRPRLNFQPAIAELESCLCVGPPNSRRSRMPGSAKSAESRETAFYARPTESFGRAIAFLTEG